MSIDKASNIIAQHGTTLESPDMPSTSHGPDEVEAACRAAEAAFDRYRAIDLHLRAMFLERIGDELLALGDDLILAAMDETGLPRSRLESERGRTIGQLRMFADVVRDGGFLDIRIEPAMPERQPIARPDTRMRMIPLGPVAVFGASNFPLAFSTAGGDTASALAAGCPVVVKAHPAHPRTGALAAMAIARAVEACGMPEGVFGHLVGPGNRLGATLVEDPRIAAVGFTGSRAGGMALLRLGQQRRTPIPVYAEMSSINPVLLLPQALAARGEELGRAFVGSLTLGAGQFCTNPGLLLAIEGEGLDRFIAAACQALTQAPATAMLTPEIQQAYERGVTLLEANRAVELLGRGAAGNRSGAQAAFFATSADAFLADDLLSEEIFGSSSLLVRCRDEADLARVITALDGQLTATLQLEAGDEWLALRLLPILERKAGRILANGWPTGVDVNHAMVHGGPWPATSNAATTSVGSLAIRRFLRPICYQDLPARLLPDELLEQG